MPQGWDSTTRYNTMGFGKDGKGVIIRESRNQALGALAQAAGIIIGTKLATLERFRMIKTEVYATITGLTTGEGTGLIFGLADGDLSLAEIEAAIELSGPLGPNDTVDEAIADRFTMLMGAIDRETGTEAIFENDEGGHLMMRTVRWTFARTKGWNFFCYNLGATITTGTVLSIRVKNFGVWVT